MINTANNNVWGPYPVVRPMGPFEVLDYSLNHLYPTASGNINELRNMKVNSYTDTDTMRYEQQTTQKETN